MDILTPKERSAVMSKIRCKNTKPEVILRKALFARGFRYRVYGKLPGKPDPASWRISPRAAQVSGAHIVPPTAPPFGRCNRLPLCRLPVCETGDLILNVQ